MPEDFWLLCEHKPGVWSIILDPGRGRYPLNHSGAPDLFLNQPEYTFEEISKKEAFTLKLTHSDL